MRKANLFCIVLIIATVAVYLQTAQHQFIDFDDPVYVSLNPRVSGGLTLENVIWAFTATQNSNWHPLTWLSHMLDVELFGMRPGLHHLMNVLIHAASTLLLFRLLARISGAPWRSLFVAALFALHPLHVESVAWVAERKDVLSTLFWLLTLLLYTRYAANPGRGRYLATLACFAAGLLAKPMLVTLPVVLLLLDWWPLNRLSRAGAGEGDAPSVACLVKEKIPFLALSALSSAVTIYSQHHGGAMKDLVGFPVGMRVANALVSYVKYLLKTIWPHELAVFYPFPTSIPAWQIICSLVLLAAVTLAVFLRRSSNPYLLTGWLWFLVTLLPVIGLIQVGGQAMADRYSYIPLIGIFVMAAWGVPDLLEGWSMRRSALPVVAGLVVAACTVATWDQLRYWRDSLTLFGRTLAVTKDNYQILNSMGITLYARRDYQGAIALYREALRVWPGSATAHLNLGAALGRIERYEEAVEQYRMALQIKPGYAMAYGNLGKALASLGRTGEALANYDQALRIDPELSRVRFNFAQLLVKAGHHDEAARQYEVVRQQSPYAVDVPMEMGNAWAQAGRLDQAAVCFGHAVRIDPGSVQGHYNLGVALARLDRPAEAAGHLAQVLRLEPNAQGARELLEAVSRQR